MERMFQRVAGVDISRDFLDVHVRTVDSETGEIERKRKRFSSLTHDLLRCSDWLKDNNVELVVMETTGIYWRAPFYVFEPAIDHVWVVNAHHVKNVPGRKTDVADAQWLADVAAHGMVKPCFVPPPSVRQLRELTRFRASLGHTRVQAVTRIDKMLQDAGIKITSVASSVLGVSTRQMFEKLIAGVRDPDELAACAKGRLRPKMGELAKALAGNFGDHHSTVIRALLDQIDLFDAQIKKLNEDIDRLITPYKEANELLLTLPGIASGGASAIIGEIGTDMSKFSTPGHLSAFGGLAPGNAESGGKSRRAGTRKGGTYLKTILVQAAWVAIRSKDSYYGAMFRRIRSRRGPMVAIVAVARKMLEAVWHMLTDGKPYVDLGSDYFEKRKDPQKRTTQLVKQLETLGHTVTLAGNPAS